MKLFIEVKQLGKSKCSIEKIPVNFLTPPITVQELIETIVYWQINEYNERLQQSEILKYLTNKDIYEDGIFRIFLNDSELGTLSSPIVLKEESTPTFICLTM